LGFPEKCSAGDAQHRTEIGDRVDQVDLDVLWIRQRKLIRLSKEAKIARRARLDAPGTLHHVIVRGIEKRRIANDVADRKNFVNRPGELAGRTNTVIYAWALMTNHAHILLRN
jgi:hypothetical protein